MAECQTETHTHTQLDKAFASILSLSLFLLPFNPILPAPAPYVKVYLLDNGSCKAKKKTKIARKTLEPLYQQHLLFDESPQGKVLQVMIWVGLKQC